MWSLELKSQTLGKRIQHDIVGPGSIHAMALSSWQSPGMTSRQGVVRVYVVCVHSDTPIYWFYPPKPAISRAEFYRVSDFQNH